MMRGYRSCVRPGTDGNLPQPFHNPIKYFELNALPQAPLLEVDNILPNTIKKLSTSDLQMLEESNPSKSLSTMDDMCFQLDLVWCINESVSTSEYLPKHSIKRILAKIRSLFCRSMPLIIWCQFRPKVLEQSPFKIIWKYQSAPWW